MKAMNTKARQIALILIQSFALSCWPEGSFKSLITVAVLFFALLGSSGSTFGPKIAPHKATINPQKHCNNSALHTFPTSAKLEDN